MCINYYLEQYRKSFYSLIKNPIVLVPDISLLVIGIFFTFGALSITGIPSLLSQAAAIATKSELSAFFSSFIKTNIVKLSITVIAFLFTMFIIGTGTIAVKLSMIHDISKNKKPTIMGAWISSRKYFWRIIGIRILVFLAYLVSLIIGIIILGVLSFVHEILAVILALLSIILLSIIIMLGFYMRYPILYSKKMIIAVPKANFREVLMFSFNLNIFSQCPAYF